MKDKPISPADLALRSVSLTRRTLEQLFVDKGIMGLDIVSNRAIAFSILDDESNLIQFAELSVDPGTGSLALRASEEIAIDLTDSV